MMCGYEGALYSSARSFDLWPNLDPKYQVDAADLDVLWRRARSLVANCDQVKMAVKTIVTLTGVLTPQPCTTDEEWNKLMRDEFMQWACNPHVFDHAGVLDWITAQHWIERRAVIDGDVFSVLTSDKHTGIPCVAFYGAHQIWGDADGYRLGVKLARNNRRISYRIMGSQSIYEAPADYVLQYRHDADPSEPRGVSELAASIANARDVHEINSYNKQSIKLAAAFGIIEEKPISSSFDAMAVAASQKMHESETGRIAGDNEPIRVGGVQAVSPAPGHKLTLLHDTRPSNETRAFIKDLIRGLAWSVGLDPEIIYYVTDMGSAGTRLSLQKLQDWIALRIADRNQWCNRIYRRYVGYALAMGRVRMCKDSAFWKVKWVNRPDKTIDRGREATAIINLYREGLLDADKYMLATEGITFEECAVRKIHALSHIKRLAESAGLTLEHVLQGALGNTNTPASIPDDGYNETKQSQTNKSEHE